MNYFENEKEIVTLIANTVKAEAEDIGDRYCFSIQRRQQEFKTYITKAEIDNILSVISSLEINDETALVSENSYEIIVREESDIPVRRFGTEKIEVHNDESGLKYELSFASDTYFIWLLSEMRKKLNAIDIRRGFFMASRAERYLEEEDEPKILEYLKMSSFRFIAPLKLIA